MNLAIVGPTYPFRGGLSHYTTHLVHHLRQHHQVAFYSYRRQYPSWLFPGNTAPDPSTTPLTVPCERPIDALNPLTWWVAADRIARTRPDVLLLQWWTPFWLPLHLTISRRAHQAGIPILYLCHQFIEPDSSLGEWFLARLGLRSADGLVVVSEEEFVMARRMFPGKPIRLGHHPLYDSFPNQSLSRTVARQYLGIAPDDPLLLFFGFVRRYKGLRYLLESLTYLSRPVRLLVAGEFWENEQPYRTYIQQAGLESQVTISNTYIPNEQIAPYFAAADAVVLPYLSGNQSGVGMIALHYGVPVITTEVGGLAEAIGHGETGLVVPPGNSRALAAAIEQFFSENLGPSFRSRITQTRDRLSWNALIRIIEELSHELQGTDPSHRPE